MKQVFCVVFLFPPTGGGGVQRTVKFVKYLPDFDWQPTVLTTLAARSLQDPSLMSDVPPQTPVVRVRGLELPRRLPWRLRRWITRWLLVVDEQIGWLPFAVRRGLATLRQQDYDAIYSTSGPYTDHLVALRLKRTTGLPWVADFRDPWVGNFSAAVATSMHRALRERLERKVVLAAECVLVVSEPMRQQFITRYPDLPATRFVTVPNGFDPADLEGIEPAERDGRFTLVYTGSLYGEKQSARPLLTALRQILQSGAISPGGVRVRFVGHAGREAPALVTEWGLDEVVEFVGYLPHDEMLAHQLCADALLLIIGAGPGSQVVFTGKIFEYLAVGKLILALIPPGAAADLLTQARAGRIVPPDDVAAIASALVDLIGAWRKGELEITPDAQVVSRYERRRLTGDLARILNDLVVES